MSDLFRVRTNVSAIFIRRQLHRNTRSMFEAQQRLSSGLRINEAADDPAGLAVSEKLRTAKRGLEQAKANAQDGISLLQTAEGGLDAINTKLQRLRELAVQSANDSLTSPDRKLIQEEVDQLVAEIDRTASTVQFNNRQLLKNNFGTINAAGSASTGQASLSFHIGTNRGEKLNISTKDISTSTASSLGLRQPGGDKIELTSQKLAESAIEKMTAAINSVSTTRAQIGAIQNRLEGAINYLEIQHENTQASESRIRDADIARETARYTRSRILVQAGQAVLAQAMETPRLLLQLLDVR